MPIVHKLYRFLRYILGIDHSIVNRHIHLSHRKLAMDHMFVIDHMFAIDHMFENYRNTDLDHNNIDHMPQRFLVLYNLQQHHQTQFHIHQQPHPLILRLKLPESFD